MNYKVGDKVKIVSREYVLNNFLSRPNCSGIYEIPNDAIFISDIMLDYCGLEVEITKIIEYSEGKFVYRIKEDSDRFNWPKEMFLMNPEVVSIREFCNYRCIMYCDKSCPLFKYKKL